MDTNGEDPRRPDENEVHPEHAGLQHAASLGTPAAVLQPAVPSITTDDQLFFPALPFGIVAFGSSAGGLQVLKEVLEHLRPDAGLAFVVITHLAVDQESKLDEILQQYTVMPVRHLVDGESPRPNELHVLQPNEIAELRGGAFEVRPRSDFGKLPKPIDIFFRSLGADQKNFSIGVVLSGADSDGANGLKAIKGDGGVALVQTPGTAQHSSMPRMSIAADHVDKVLDPAELGLELSRLGELLKKPEVATLEQGQIPPTDDQSFLRILQLVRSASGFDLRQYKPDTIRRRIARRMVLLRIETLAEYVRFLQLRSDEVKTLQEESLINVTRFFRDPQFWDSLSNEVLPAFFVDRPTEKPVRVWCAGCSSGEEVYSIAITILEYLIANGLETTLQVFGTDASERSIDMARTAIYPETLSGEISQDRLRRFFVKVDRGYQVSKRVRDCCIFAQHNLASDPPFSQIDFLSCRNVMIYFNEALQKQVLAVFHYALQQDGLLLLGSSETLRDSETGFTVFDRKQKIYRRSPGSTNLLERLPLAHAKLLPALGRQPQAEGEEVWPDLELQRAADRLVLAQFGPPGLIIDEHYEVLQARGHTAPYVEILAGVVSWNLARVVRPSISREVLDAVERVMREKIPVSKAAILKTDGADQPIQIDVLPIGAGEVRSKRYLVMFSNVQDARNVRSPGAPQLATVPAEERDRLNIQLNEDLSSTRFHLQALIEERDARNQELVSANEEIQSSNEELQSTNEELETTKEELQSANEELQTVNHELQQRNAVLTQTGNDLNNLLTSVNIPLLMLTEDFSIRQFTPPMERLLNVRSTDIGRSIGEIRLQLSVEDIQPILREVLETLGTRELEVQDREGRWHIMRVRPYRTSDNRIEGVVLVLVDVDQLRTSQQELLEARDFASSIVQSVPVPVVVVRKDCTIQMANQAFAALSGIKSKELLDASFPDLMERLWSANEFRTSLNGLFAAEPGETLAFDHESGTPNGRTLRFRAQAHATDGARVVLVTIEDITLRTRAERQLEQQKIQLESEIEETRKTLSAAQEELRDLATHLFSVQETERRRVASELHDDVAQRLSLLQIQFESLRAEQRPDPSRIETMYEDLKALNDDVRNLSHRLHPKTLNDLGLPTAIKELVDDFRVHEQMFATYIGTHVPESVSPDAATAVYRIAQEALRNVSKHAGKTHVKLLLEGKGTTLELVVRDMGVGFDTEAELPRRGLGLVSMKERARMVGGSLTVESSLGTGTVVTLQVPVHGHA